MSDSQATPTPIAAVVVAVEPTVQPDGADDGEDFAGFDGALLTEEDLLGVGLGREDADVFPFESEHFGVGELGPLVGVDCSVVGFHLLVGHSSLLFVVGLSDL